MAGYFTTMRESAMLKKTMKSMARVHWEKNRPKMVAHLKANNVYETALENNARIANDVLSSKLRLGADPQAAEKYVLMTWICLPDEEAEPILDSDIMPFSQPDEELAGSLPPQDLTKVWNASEHF
jgi:hypothetical protein